MPARRIIMITGVSGFFGSRVALRLFGMPGVHVVGLDARPPRAEALRDLDFIQADIRNPLLPELFKGEGVDSLVHLSFVESDRPVEQTFDANVTGAARVLAAAAAAGIRQVVLQSSTMVYGARPDNSAFLNEEHPIHGSRRSGAVRDLAEIETFCAGFARQAPALTLCILRFPSIVGPAANTPMTRFLGETWSPRLLGFDPMMQVIHEDDVADALVHAALSGAQGAFNIAAEGNLPLTRLMALAGKLPIPLPHLWAYWGRELLRGPGMDSSRYLPIEPDYLRYPWVADTARMHAEFGRLPCHTAVQTLVEFAGLQRVRRMVPGHYALAYDEERLRDTIERRRQARAHAEVGGDEPPTESSQERESDG